MRDSIGSRHVVNPWLACIIDASPLAWFHASHVGVGGREVLDGEAAAHYLHAIFVEGARQTASELFAHLFHHGGGEGLVGKGGVNLYGYASQ